MLNVRFNALACQAVVEQGAKGARLEIFAATAHAFERIEDVHGIVLAIAGPVFGRVICAQLPKVVPAAVTRKDWNLINGVRLALEITPGGLTRFGASNLTAEKARALIAPYQV